MKRRIIAFVLIIFTLLLVGCAEELEDIRQKDKPQPISRTVENMDTFEAALNSKRFINIGSAVFSNNAIYYIGKKHNIYEYNLNSKETNIVFESKEIIGNLLLFNNKLYFSHRNEIDRENEGLSEYDLFTNERKIIVPCTSSFDTGREIFSVIITEKGVAFYDYDKKEILNTNGELIAKSEKFRRMYSGIDSIYYVEEEFSQEKMYKIDLNSKEKIDVTEILNKVSNISIIHDGYVINKEYLGEDRYEFERIIFDENKIEKLFIVDENQGVTFTRTNNKIVVANYNFDKDILKMELYSLDGKHKEIFFEEKVNLYIQSLYVFNGQVFAYIKPSEISKSHFGKIEELDGTIFEHITDNIYKVRI